MFKESLLILSLSSFFSVLMKSELSKVNGHFRKTADGLKIVASFGEGIDAILCPG